MWNIMEVIACITESKHERRICVVYRLGGVGKTQLVLKVIERTWDEWDHIIYIDTSSQESIEKALRDSSKTANSPIGGPTAGDLQRPSIRSPEMERTSPEISGEASRALNLPLVYTSYCP